MSEPTETEVKFRVASPEVAREAVSRTGATLVRERHFGGVGIEKYRQILASGDVHQPVGQCLPSVAESGHEAVKGGLLHLNESHRVHGQPLEY